MASVGGQDVESDERSRVSAPETSWALRDANRAAAAVDQVLAQRMHLKPMDYHALSLVMSAEGRLGPVELGTRLGISSGSASELVDRLERSGHVERQREAADRRRVTLRATDSTVRQLLDELLPVFDAIDGLADQLTNHERVVIVRFLRAAAEAMWSFDAPT